MLLCLISLVLMSPAVSCKHSTFEKDVSLNDLLLFEEFTLGPPSDKSMDECAQDCHGNQSCTTFSISLGDNGCQLYGDVAYPDIYLAQELPGRRYYVYTNGVCPYDDEFVIMRQSNLCIRIFRFSENYNDVVHKCEQFEARPIVLEEENKATAAMDLLQRNGDGDKVFYLGAHVQGTHPNFVWVDGQNLTLDMWRDGEPNNLGDENCVYVFQNEMVDINCIKPYWFICEIPQ